MLSGNLPFNSFEKVEKKRRKGNKVLIHHFVANFAKGHSMILPVRRVTVAASKYHLIYFTSKTFKTFK